MKKKFLAGLAVIATPVALWLVYREYGSLYCVNAAVNIIAVAALVWAVPKLLRELQKLNRLGFAVIFAVALVIAYMGPFLAALIEAKSPLGVWRAGLPPEIGWPLGLAGSFLMMLPLLFVAMRWLKRYCPPTALAYATLAFAALDVLRPLLYFVSKKMAG